MLQFLQRWIYLAHAYCFPIVKHIPQFVCVGLAEVELGDMAGGVVAGHTSPPTAVFAGPRRKPVVGVVHIRFDGEESSPLAFHATAADSLHLDMILIAEAMAETAGDEK
ncbi:unnamed protein product [Musa acuminata subsp. malaccensis]|uniref:(wild Malaysian banana) hypothetical protein n=1 Tax=Musa acuminata subsp. malaccensis TaxID=214687 RepID=A0A8D7APJ8_MUSAM|nr:unnamed protein product [Musa acuminata subsp. malaccensis]